MKTKKTRVVRAWAEIGTHGHIFAFTKIGPVASRYPNMMHIYSKKKPGLVPVTITYEVPK